MDRGAFFTVHHDLPREGPGEPADVAFALNLAGLPAGATICDAGAGRGGDVVALLAAPGARVLAIETEDRFVAAMRARLGDDPRVQVERWDMAALDTHPWAPFDLIWCAGALYFLGPEDGLGAMGRALRPGGVPAFSEPCFRTATPSAAARDFWEGYPTLPEADVLRAVSQGGFTVPGTRILSDSAWEAYCCPMEARIAALRPGADARLTAMLDQCAAEAAQWRAVRAETGYLLAVARWAG